MHDDNGTRTALAAVQTASIRQVLIEALERRGIVSVERHAGDGSICPCNDDRLRHVADAVGDAHG
jgi:hypothetical protein